ncbi:DUF6172 family protein [Haloferula sp. A504]|uniref:DUF6172 family protein n=1 Tax=Haloferula sp. A504 TaxID=3373601 RepID=UPI0031BCF0DC|nr:DUF6172 family protein [Verrucomicrobiaceae bacterium E54]
MKKSFPLEVPGIKPPRVVAAIKNDVRKYIKRERRKPLPEDVDFCDFACRVGTEPESATEAHVAELIALIDNASRKEWPAIYIEILAKPGYRTKKPGPESATDE